ncbi:MAG: hypothetical protein EOQ47_01570 [Mesorhizobium sp.]|nr:MAG: hypothetical protein EOQ47_01570 [Mesorhizobium sp.]
MRKIKNLKRTERIWKIATRFKRIRQMRLCDGPAGVLQHDRRKHVAFDLAQDAGLLDGVGWQL